ncbi:MAG: hypothetical protein ABSC36_00370 [Gaiellaceae bacterium]|jgi:hypothetical protein
MMTGRTVMVFLIVFTCAGAAYARSSGHTYPLHNGDGVTTGTPWACRYQSAAASALGKAELFCAYGPSNNFAVSMEKGQLEVVRFKGSKVTKLFETTKVQ